MSPQPVFWAPLMIHDSWLSLRVPIVIITLNVRRGLVLNVLSFQC